MRDGSRGTRMSLHIACTPHAVLWHDRVRWTPQAVIGHREHLNGPRGQF